MRTGSLIVGIILLLVAVYFFFDAKNMLDCLSSATCILQRGLIPNNISTDPYSGYRQNAQLQQQFSFVLGIVGIVLLGYGAGGSKQTPQIVYQQLPPSSQQPTQPTVPSTSPPPTQLTPGPQVRRYYCTNCGSQFSTDEKFCGQCGRERK